MILGVFFKEINSRFLSKLVFKHSLYSVLLANAGWGLDVALLKPTLLFLFSDRLH